MMAQYAATSSMGTSSPQPSLRSAAMPEELGQYEVINLQIFVPELQLQKCLTVSLDDLVWDIKRKLFASLPQPLPQSFNYGLFLPPCDGRAGKFLLEDRPLRDYPFHDCVPYVELKYKKRVYKMLKLDEKALKQLHSKNNLKKFMDYIESRNAEKVDKWCSQGLDPNFHDSQGETPLTLASGIAKNEKVLVALVGGGAHIDFRNSEGQTGMHKAAFLSRTENVKTLLELGASPNYKDPIGLTPLYYSMLTTDSHDAIAQMLLAEAAEIEVTDMHGNHELHQACKNGLVKHAEHLLYYGAQINTQNINGNTPLHICAIQNKPDCARVLLFRGVDPMIMNKQGQTALHIAHLVGHTGVAEAIQTHNPHNAVPYRGTPKYNTRRRLGSQIVRRRSLSQVSIGSARSECYQTPQTMRQAPVMPSPTPSRLSASQPSEYGTLRRYPMEAVQHHAAGFESNIPRILVIPRGPKGFGFILRGAKHVDSEVEFHPTLDMPALQFFEGVDMSGMAMKAGLRPGDFLLEINGVDVRSASHEQVVQLIHQSQETITLKVITVETAPEQRSHYAATAGTLPIRRNHSVPRNSGLPPMPPQRHPSTSLSYGHHTMGYSIDPQSPASSNYGMSHNGMTPTKSSDSLVYPNDPIRVASVKSRPSASRRISAAELEHLMIRQCSSNSQFQPIPYEQDSYAQGAPMKFTSVADMKRRKQRNGMPSPSLNNNGLPRTNSMNEEDIQNVYTVNGPLKSFSSSPELHQRMTAEQPELRKPNAVPGAFTEYQRPQPPANLGVLRPKTPPPPPPEEMAKLEATYNQMTSNNYNHIAASTNHNQMSTPSPSMNNNKMMTSSMNTSNSSTPSKGAPPPPPPPPPPPDFYKSSKPVTSSKQTAPKPLSAFNITDAMQNVKLKPVNNNTIENNNNITQEEGGAKNRSSVDFHSDLKNALAKRRSKVAEDDLPEEKVEKEPQQTKQTTESPSYGGLSLRESVRENVQAQSKNLTKQHSPSGFAAKKDSGYTSSRTSLEPSECGDEQVQPLTPIANTNGTTIRINENAAPELLMSSHNSRVTLISQQLEDNFVNTSSRHQDTISIASSLSNFSNCSASVIQTSSKNTVIEKNYSRTPPIDYEGPESDQDSCSTSAALSRSSHDSGHQSTALTVPFDQKHLIEWSCADVGDWLGSLNMSEYAQGFFKQGIRGQDLVQFDRTRFTQLGVTRIGHRQSMEQSLRLHSKQD